MLREDDPGEVGGGGGGGGFGFVICDRKEGGYLIFYY